MSHGEATELLGAYALDAIEGEERDALERHTEQCAECQAEILSHREVAGLLTPGWLRPPEEVWERIAASLEETPPPLDLAPVIAMRPGPEGAAPAASRPRGRRRRGVITLVAAVAAIAASIVAVLGVKVADDEQRIRDLAKGEQLQHAVDAALADRSARQVDLRSTDGAVSVHAVMLNDGTGYLVGDNLPPLSSDKTYQLWALVGTSKISVGVLGTDPGITAFRATGPVWGLAITAESAGGSVEPRHDPVVVGRVQEA